MEDYRYTELADTIEMQIGKGTYPIGEKLPSLRMIHKAYGVSIGTALKAYLFLIDKGLVTGKERSGYIVLRKTVSANSLPVGTSSTPILLDISKETKGDAFIEPFSLSKDGISFFRAELSPDLMPFSAIRRSLLHASRDLTGRHLQYETVAGNQALQQEIAKRSFHWKGALAAKDIVITNGATEAVSLCLRAVTKPGDSILVQMPFYHGLIQTIVTLGLKIVALGSGSVNGIDITQLKQAYITFKPAACLLISNFNNPTGMILSNKQKQEIAQFANKMKLPVIDDDVYGDLHFYPGRPTNLKTYDQQGWVLLCSSFSKSIAPGYRLGWCAPGRFTDEVLRLKAATTAATNSMVQLSLLSLLKTGAFDRHLRKLRQTLHRLVTLTSNAIEQYFPEATRVSRPQGGLVLWIKLPETVDALTLRKAALKERIDLAPGTLFSNTGDYTKYIRISCHNPWNSRTETALKKLGKLCTGLMERAVE